MNDTVNTTHDAQVSLGLAIDEADGTGLVPMIVTALMVTHGARQDTYAHPFINFLNTALEWTKDAHDFGELPDTECYTPYSVARKMRLLKKARLVSTPHRDGMIDRTGYDSCEDRIAVWLIKNGYVHLSDHDTPELAWQAAMRYFDHWSYTTMYSFYRAVLADLALGDDSDLPEPDAIEMYREWTKAWKEGASVPSSAPETYAEFIGGQLSDPKAYTAWWQDLLFDFNPAWKAEWEKAIADGVDPMLICIYFSEIWMREVAKPEVQSSPPPPRFNPGTQD